MTSNNSLIVKRLVAKTQPIDSVITLDPNRKSPSVSQLEEKLSQMIIGQDRAVRVMSQIYQNYTARLNSPHRTISNLLFLGPTGCGKTRVAEAMAKTLHRNPDKLIRIDCAEFQHDHEIAKLTGSPPGYLGHMQTGAVLTQENLDHHKSKRERITLILFDEIEKASDALWMIMLGIMDKATLSLGNNQKVDFTDCIIMMTSNLGAREMNKLISGSIGFAPVKNKNKGGNSALDEKLYRTAKDAAIRKFPPEFMNRIDKTIVFRSLQLIHLRKILDIELRAIQTRIHESSRTKFHFECSDFCKDFLLQEGTEINYGARPLRRALERYITYPLANIVASGQVNSGDELFIDYQNGKPIFRNFPNQIVALDSVFSANS